MCDVNVGMGGEVRRGSACGDEEGVCWRGSAGRGEEGVCWGGGGEGAGNNLH